MKEIVLKMSEEEFNILRDIIYRDRMRNIDFVEKYIDIAKKYIFEPDYKYDGCTQKQAEQAVSKFMDEGDRILKIESILRNTTMHNR